ncbi:hypothetical protein [Lysobacter tyrosinilyticus]
MRNLIDAGEYFLTTHFSKQFLRRLPAIVEVGRAEPFRSERFVHVPFLEYIPNLGMRRQQDRPSISAGVFVGVLGGSHPVNGGK